MTSVDLELMFEHYDVYNIEYFGGWKFKASDKLFIDYVDKWSNIKIEAKKSGNFALYTLAKLMMNSLYGKFALNPKVCSKIPYLNPDQIVSYVNDAEEYRDPVYIPVGAFITSWARSITIRAAQQCYDRFIYADTDSLHLTGLDLPKGLNISDTELGAWKHEGTFRKARYIRNKAYIEDMVISQKDYNKLLEDETPGTYIEDGKYYHQKVTCSGMPDSCYANVTWDNFKPGSKYEGKLQIASVPGGMILRETDFTLNYLN
jgi:hypothetical protein